MVPAAFVLPAGWPRCLLTLASVGLHIGIAVSQSAGIGLAFLPNVATYILGFGSSVTVLSPEWFTAIIFGFAGPAMYLLLAGARTLPEDWPMSPFALFPWSGPQWNILFGRFVTGDTRLVLSTTAVKADGLVGRTVRPKHGTANEWGSVEPGQPGASESTLHDGWELVMGETVIHDPVVRAIDWQASWKPTAFTAAVEAWLARDSRLVEIETGAPLRYCSFVRVDSGNVVVDVIS